MNAASAVVVDEIIAFVSGETRYTAKDARRSADRHDELARSLSGSAGDVARKSSREYVVLGEMLGDFPAGVDLDLLSALRVQAREMVEEWRVEDAPAAR